MDRPGAGNAERLRQHMSKPEQVEEAGSGDKPALCSFYVPSEDTFTDSTGSTPAVHNRFVPCGSQGSEEATAAAPNAEQQPANMQSPERISLWRPSSAAPDAQQQPDNEEAPGRMPLWRPTPAAPSANGSNQSKKKAKSRPTGQHQAQQPQTALPFHYPEFRPFQIQPKHQRQHAAPTPPALPAAAPAPNTTAGPASEDAQSPPTPHVAPSPAVGRTSPTPQPPGYPSPVVAAGQQVVLIPRPQLPATPAQQVAQNNSPRNLIRKRMSRLQTTKTPLDTILNDAPRISPVLEENPPVPVPQAGADVMPLVQQSQEQPQLDTFDYLSVCDLGKPPSNPGRNAPLAKRKEYLEQQLDALAGQDVLLHLRVLSGPRNRLSGGQAVVQLVEDNRNRAEYAMKFFLSEKAFQQEKTLYLDDVMPLGQFLPQLFSIVEERENGQLHDPWDNSLPSCIIMERGEALDLWVAESGRLDTITCLQEKLAERAAQCSDDWMLERHTRKPMQVIYHIAERLRDLHEAGYVHRDIKPANIMWLPRKKRWTLIDFGCAAPIDSMAPTGFSLHYAAPEVINSYEAGDRQFKAAAAVDSWSLGILAIEIMNNKPIFGHWQPVEQTVEMILGERPAPWEDPATKRQVLKPLGLLKKMVLQLLHRDPSKRSTAAQVRKACAGVIASTTLEADES